MTCSAIGRRAAVAAGLGAGVALSEAARGQSAFPSQPVRLLLPQGPGSGGDTVARILADAVSRGLGQPLVLESRPGANGLVAINALKQARPDGHTLLLSGVSQLSFNPHLYPNLGYDPARDFTYVAPVTDTPFVLVASRRSGVASVQDLVARARARPGEVTYASAGIGNSTHLAAEMVADRAGLRLSHVPYSGSGPALTSVVAGQTDAMVSVLGIALPQVAAGAVAPLAVVAERRVPQLPEVPTQREAGLDAPVMPGWFAVLGPAGMPQAAVDVLNAAFRRALEDEAVRRRLEENTLEPLAGTAADIRGRMEADSAVWGGFIRRRGLRVE
jgi:tripartite-type tricarboxylate transporter receptor subunit TctC